MGSITYELFQNYEALEWEFGGSGGTSLGDGPGGGSRSIYESWSKSQKIQQRDVIKASEFISMRQAGPENGVPAVYHTSLLGERVFKHTIPWWWIMSHLHPPDESFPYIKPRPHSEQRLKKWEEADLERLGLRQLGITLEDMVLSREELERRLKLLGRGKQRKRVDLDSDFYRRMDY